MNLILHAGSPCVNGSVRLIGGLVPTEGAVQMCMWERDGEDCAVIVVGTTKRHLLCADN